MTKLQIANLALLRVGSNAVLQSLDQDSTDAAIINTLLEPTVRETLREAAWSSALKRIALVKSSTTPSFQYTSSYPLPADFVRLIEVYDSAGEIHKSNYWKIEGKNLLTDMAAVNITYIHLPEDFDIFDDLLAGSIVVKLAIKLAMPKTDNEKLVTALTLEYEQLTAQRAKSIDAIENFEESTFGEVDWVDSRYRSI